MELEKGVYYLFCIIGGEAVDNKDLARRKRRKPLQAPLNVELFVLCEDDDGNIGHLFLITKDTKGEVGVAS